MKHLTIYCCLLLASASLSAALTPGSTVDKVDNALEIRPDASGQAGGLATLFPYSLNGSVVITSYHAGNTTNTGVFDNYTSVDDIPSSVVSGPGNFTLRTQFIDGSHENLMIIDNHGWVAFRGKRFVIGDNADSHYIHAEHPFHVYADASAGTHHLMVTKTDSFLMGATSSFLDSSEWSRVAMGAHVQVRDSFSVGIGNHIRLDAGYDADNDGVLDGYMFALGNNLTVTKRGGIAVGHFIQSHVPGLTVLGRHNKTGGVAEEGIYEQEEFWWPGKTTVLPLLVVGAGTGGNEKDAMVIWDDGTVEIDKVPPRGGISMGQFQ